MDKSTGEIMSLEVHKPADFDETVCQNCKSRGVIITLMIRFEATKLGRRKVAYLAAGPYCEHCWLPLQEILRDSVRRDKLLSRIVLKTTSAEGYQLIEGSILYRSVEPWITVELESLADLSKEANAAKQRVAELN